MKQKVDSAIRRSPVRGRGLLIITAAAAVSGCSAEAPVILASDVGAEQVELTPAACEVETAFRVDTVAAGLDTPWDVAFRSNGDAFVSERPGRIVRIPAGGQPEPWLDFEVYSPGGSEIGLLGVDLSTDESALYFGATNLATTNPVSRILRRLFGGMSPDGSANIVAGVYRVPIGPSGPGTVEEIVSGLPAGFIHGGGALRFGPDGLLYVTNGDAGEHGWSQAPESLRGKVLRFTEGGEPRPADGSSGPVYATGIRSSQGIAWIGDPPTLLAIDHGPTGLESEGRRTDNDELNVVSPGANLGWPIMAGPSAGGGLTSPIASWTPALAPAGLEIVGSNAFVTGLRGTRLERIAIEETPDGPVARCQEPFLQEDFGRLRLIRQAPDGSLWVGTSNRDGRGVPREGGDHILRLTFDP